MLRAPLRHLITILALASACVLAACAGAPAPAPEPPITPEERELCLQSFDHVWSTIRDKHWDPGIGGVDWQGVRDELRPRAEAATTRSEFAKTMNAMLARLGISHMAVMSSRGPMQPEEGGGGASPGLDVRVLDGHALVTEVTDGSSAAEQGVRRGWEILAVGGRDLAPKLARTIEQYKASTQAGLHLRRMVRSRIEGADGSKVEVTFLTGDRRKRTIELTRRNRKGEMASLGHMHMRPVRFEATWAAPSVGCIAFDSFMDPMKLMPAFEEAVRRFMNATGIVIDLRGNPGGIGLMSSGLASWFVQRDGWRLGTMTMRGTTLNFVIIPRVETYTGPLAILVDECSASTSEIMAGGLQDLGRARVFGVTSAGAALPSHIEKLPNGDLFQYAVANYVSQSGKVLEGHGVVPDEIVPLSREALLAGRDPQLEAAVRWIQRSMQ